MSDRLDVQALLDPLSEAEPCGINGDATGVLFELDALRLYGQTRSPEAQPETEDEGKQSEKAKPPVDWAKMRSDTVDALSKSKDLRLLGYLALALLRTDGLPAFLQTIPVASFWLETYWPQLHPQVDEDALERRNALNCFADPMAVVDRVWRLPLVSSRQHGRFGLRDVEIARGAVPPGAKDIKAEEHAVTSAFAELPVEELERSKQLVADALAALSAIDSKMRSEGGPEVAPDFGPLSTQLAKLNRLYGEQLATRTPGVGAAGDAGDGSAEGAGIAAGGYTGGAIRSRDEAIRALDAVAEFFRTREPSSPIPLFIDRAKRLVAKDFLEVLADIAPDALSGARSAAGLRDS